MSERREADLKSTLAAISMSVNSGWWMSVVATLWFMLVKFVIMPWAAIAVIPMPFYKRQK